MALWMVLLAVPQREPPSTSAQASLLPILVKPDAGTSVSPSKDFDWGKFLDPSLYLVFPFCLPWDLVELVKTLSAEPQAPVIDWPMPTLTGQQNLHVDLSPWSPVAAVLRAGELIVAAVGLIWITKTMIRN